MTLHPVMLGRDRAAWRLLVTTARNAAGNPGSARIAMAFRYAADAAFKSVLPDPSAQTLRICRELIGCGREAQQLARTWRGLDPETRADAVEELQRLAEALAELIGGAPTVPPTPDPPPPAAAAAKRLPYHDDSFDEDAA